MVDSGRGRRADTRRRKAVLRKTRLQRVESDLSPLTGASAVSLVYTLTRESWTASRKPWPEYDRAHTPVRFVPGRHT